MISTPVQIRFADCDMGGHVHNAAYLHYFESARINFFVSEFGRDWDWKKYGLIVKKNTITYHIPTYLEDEIRVNVSCNHIGGKSFTLTYHVLDSKDNLKAYGESVIVSFDYEKQTTTTVQDSMLNLLRKHHIED